jgi:hypothetical protein
MYINCSINLFADNLQSAAASATSASGIPQPGPKAGTTESTPIAPTGDAIPSKEPGSEKQ